MIYELIKKSRRKLRIRYAEQGTTLVLSDMLGKISSVYGQLGYYGVSFSSKLYLKLTGCIAFLYHSSASSRKDQHLLLRTMITVMMCPSYPTATPSQHLTKNLCLFGHLNTRTNSTSPTHLLWCALPSLF